MRKYLIIIEKTETGYSAYVPDLPGCIASGRTKEIVEKHIYDAIQFHIEGLKEMNAPIPGNKTEAGNIFVKV
jgi:predicted RNase H-like HicB family nuclease